MRSGVYSRRGAKLSVDRLELSVVVVKDSQEELSHGTSCLPSLLVALYKCNELRCVLLSACAVIVQYSPVSSSPLDCLLFPSILRSPCCA